jgi:hypothetical protein
VNHAELCALVAEREQMKKPWVSIPTSDLKELLDNYKPPEPPAFLYMGTQLDTDA